MNELFGNREIVIKALVGSHNYNLNTPSSDRDFKYFVTPTLEDLYYGNRFSTSKQSDTFDYDCHDIRQLGDLLWKANINFIEVLFSTDYVYDTRLSWLFRNRETFAFMNMVGFGNATFGMHKQKMGELHKGTAKTDILIEEYGYDTKQACHALRCLYVMEKLHAGFSMGESLYFHKDSVHRKNLLSVKNGELTEDQFIDLVADWKKEYREKVNEFFQNHTPQWNVKEELDNYIREFVFEKIGVKPLTDV